MHSVVALMAVAWLASADKLADCQTDPAVSSISRLPELYQCPEVADPVYGVSVDMRMFESSGAVLSSA